ncbi:MAG: hypothetical protein Kow0099_15650 [Candidatus Abyssubacteria bacterium]
MAPFCPICRSEYEEGVERCADCGSALVQQLPPEDSEAEPEAEVVEIWEAAGEKEALVIKGLLESEGIMCSLSADVPHSVIPLTVDGLGAVRIFVSEEDAERAREILSSYEQEI